jgi:hypothetical protein
MGYFEVLWDCSRYCTTESVVQWEAQLRISANSLNGFLKGTQIRIEVEFVYLGITGIYIMMLSEKYLRVLSMIGIMCTPQDSNEISKNSPSSF